MVIIAYPAGAIVGATGGTITTITGSTTLANQVAITAVPIGATAVTQRKIYRTATAASQLQLQQTIADNTSTTGITDVTADAGLGANVPTSDSSALAQPTGQVIAGGTAVSVAGLGAFSSSGGWAIIGNGQQVIRYTGKTSTALTGVPPSGAGAIVATISYNSTITAAPQLLGIPASGAGSILYAIVKGDNVNLVAQVDDAASQATLSALLDPSNLLGGAAGIIEDYTQDGRISYTEALARATARLTLLGATAVSITYSVRDPLTMSGKMIAVNLPSPTSVDASYQIQRVTISAFSATAGLFPTYHAEASSTKFTFEDLVKHLISGQVGA